jgi:hypothetical protein
MLEMGNCGLIKIVNSACAAESNPHSFTGAKKVLLVFFY